MITIKLRLKNENNNYAELLKQFSNGVHFAYNRYQDNPNIKDSEVEFLIKTKMNNIGLLDASLIKQVVLKAKTLKDKPKVIFGGKLNYLRYLKGLITKEEYKTNKLLPLRVVGSKTDNGNRKFGLDLTNHKIVFKYNRNIHYELEYFRSSKNNEKLLKLLQDKYDNNKKEVCFTVELNKEYVWITFDELELKTSTYNFKVDRVAGIDINPNYIALAIRDKTKIILKKLYSLKGLNDLDKRKNYVNIEDKVSYRKYLHNKRKYETLEISKNIFSILKQYKVETLVLEDLNIKSKNNKLGKRFNKLCNNDWLRNTFVNNLNKRCNLLGIKVEKVFAGYSSIKGQLEHEDDVDSIAAAIELSNRINKNLKDFGNTKVNIEKLSNRWKKEIISNFKQCPTWKDISNFLKKKFKSSYRNFFNINKTNVVSYSLNSYKSKVLVYKFI